MNKTEWDPDLCQDLASIFMNVGSREREISSKTWVVSSEHEFGVRSMWAAAWFASTI